MIIAILFGVIAFLVFALTFQTWRKRVYKLRAKRAFRAVDSASETIRIITAKIDRIQNRRETPTARSDRDWPETNCELDLWIELAAARGFEPEAMLGFTIGQDFIADQFTLLVPHREELERFYGARVNLLGGKFSGSLNYFETHEDNSAVTTPAGSDANFTTIYQANAIGDLSANGRNIRGFGDLPIVLRDTGRPRVEEVVLYDGSRVLASARIVAAA